MDFIEVLFRSLTDGGPYALGIIGCSAWLYERRENKAMTRQLLALATAQIETSIKHEQAIQANTQIIDRLMTR